MRKDVRIKNGEIVLHKVMAKAKHGILQCVPVRPLKEGKGMILGLDTKELRDETERT